MTAQAVKHGAPTQKRKSLVRFVHSLPLLVMALPGLVYLFINNYMPIAGLVVAFKKYTKRGGLFGSKWIGFENFKFLFRTKDAWNITTNTILYNLAFIFFGTIVAIFLAIILSEINSKRVKSVYQGAILLPYLMSTVIIAYLVYAFLAGNGFVNKTILPMLGMEEISWYSSPQYWPFILVFLSVWKGCGYQSLIYMSSILGIDRSLYESVALDGGTKWHMIRNVTLPLIKPTIITMTLIAVGNIFYSDFGLFYQVPMNSGPLVDATNVIDTYVYRTFINSSNVGMSSAAGVYQSIVGFVLVVVSNIIVRRIEKDSALF